jgi:hypothetical protein
MKLHFLGYRRLDDDAPEAPREVDTRDDKAEASPIKVFGEKAVLNSKKLHEYINPQTSFYLNVVQNNLRFGLPYGWDEAPHWMLWLHGEYDVIKKEYESHMQQMQNEAQKMAAGRAKAMAARRRR